MRRVIIGTPTYSGNVSMRYCCAIVKTCRLAAERGICIDIVYTSGDALVQKSRNYLIAFSILNNFDDLIFIDDDIEWDPEWIFQLLNYSFDVVSGVYRKKIDDEIYTVNIKTPVIRDSLTGLIKADGLPTGFLKLSFKACKALWDSSEIYTNGTLKSERMIFDLKIIDETLYSEDYIVSKKLIDLGFDLWVDPRMCCIHIGIKPFIGNFVKYLGSED
jgi:glycosyltransferase involved in cell wall biosynthesis